MVVTALLSIKTTWNFATDFDLHTENTYLPLCKAHTWLPNTVSLHVCACIGGAQELTLTSQPQTSGTYYCPGPVTFTCVGTQINALIWRVNGSNEATYVFLPTHMFPFTLNSPLDGVMVEITSASFNSPPSFDATSVLNVSDVSVLNETSLQCAASLDQSDIFQIQVLTPSKLVLHHG